MIDSRLPVIVAAIICGEEDIEGMWNGFSEEQKLRCEKAVSEVQRRTFLQVRERLVEVEESLRFVLASFERYVDRGSVRSKLQQFEELWKGLGLPEEGRIAGRAVYEKVVKVFYD